MNIQSIAIQRAINMLIGANAQFKVITSDGQEFGELCVAEPKPAGIKRGEKYGWGVATEYVKNFIGSMEPGQVVVIPAHNVIAVKDIQSTASSWCARYWGKGSAMTTINNGQVEVLRVS